MATRRVMFGRLEDPPIRVAAERLRGHTAPHDLPFRSREGARRRRRSAASECSTPMLAGSDGVCRPSICPSGPAELVRPWGR